MTSMTSFPWNPLKWVSAVSWRLGFALRETGQSMERSGCKMQGIHSYEEPLSRHVPICNTRHIAPSLAKDTFVAPSGLVLGSAVIDSGSSVWYNAHIRGDRERVIIGKNTNIQDSAFVGAMSEFSPDCIIGDNVAIGHGAVLKGCTVGNNVLVGIGAVVSENAVLEDGCIVAAGAFVEEFMVVPSGEVWAGSPAKKLRDLKPGEAEYLRTLPLRYSEMATKHSEVMEVLRAKQAEYYS